MRDALSDRYVSANEPHIFSWATTLPQLIQQQHIAMARKRQRRLRASAAAGISPQHSDSLVDVDANGVSVNVRHINTGDEGVLYTHRITVSSCSCYSLSCHVGEYI